MRLRVMRSMNVMRYPQDLQLMRQQIGGNIGAGRVADGEMQSYGYGAS